MSMDGNKAIFLDRDGTINIEKHYLYKISDFEYIDGAIDGLKVLSEMGFLLVIVTNQSGIARGYYTESDYLQLDQWLKNDLAQKGIPIAGSYFCPHLPEGIIPRYSIECECRKPKTALFWKAAADLNIDMDRCFAIGDKERDLSICDESKVRGILLSDKKTDLSKYSICSDWNQIVDTIMMKESRSNG